MATILRRFLQPTLADLLGILLLSEVILVGSHRLFGDADIGTHIATGRWILEHREIPKTDPFSGPFFGREWFAHEWLADLGMCLVHRTFGWPGMVWVSALLIGVAHVLLYRHLLGRGADALVSLAAVILAASAAASHWLARPHLVTVLFLVILTAILEDVVAGRRSRGWLLGLPPLVLVWVNLHGGFLIALATLGFYGAGILVAAHPWRTGNRTLATEAILARHLLAPFALAGLASGVAMLLNPWGYRLPEHLITFFATRGAALTHTSEFEPARFDDRAGIALAVFLLICLAAIAVGIRATDQERWSRGRPRPRAHGYPTGPVSQGPARPLPFHPVTLIAFAVTATMALRSIRDAEILAVFGTIVIADGASAWIRRTKDAALLRFLEGLRNYETCRGGGLFAIGLFLTGALAIGGIFPRAGFDRTRFPVDMVQGLKKSGVEPVGPVFTPDVWGGYLILEWPQVQVYVDGRWDMRGDAFFERYSEVVLARPGWDERLVVDNVNWALVPPDVPLAEAMRSASDWQLWRSDAIALVFRRKVVVRCRCSGPPRLDGVFR